MLKIYTPESRDGTVYKAKEMRDVIMTGDSGQISLGQLANELKAVSRRYAAACKRATGHIPWLV